MSSAVSGVTAFGVFAELDNTIEGLIRIEKLPGGSYEYIEDKFTLKGERTFRLGDRIKIRVDGCDWGNMRTEFSLADVQDGGHTRERFERREKHGRRDQGQGGGKRTKKTADRMHKNGRGRRKK